MANKKKDKKLVSHQDHEIYYIMGRYDIPKKELLEVMQATGRSRNNLYAELEAMGYKRRVGNWENNFKKVFYDNGKTPKTDWEIGAMAAITWMKEYSPLNPEYLKPHEI